MEAKSTQQGTTTGSDVTDDGNGPSHSSPREPGETLSKDVAFQILSTKRRRGVLRYLKDDPETTLGELAEHIAAIENDKPEQALSSSERKRVYVALYQCHLPRMDDADVIDFEKHRGTVTRGVYADQLGQYLAASEESMGTPDSERAPCRSWASVTGPSESSDAPWSPVAHRHPDRIRARSRRDAGHSNT